MRPSMTHHWTGKLIALGIFVITLVTLPSWWCGRQAPAIYAGQQGAVEPLARRVAKWVQRGVRDADFNTGNSRFDAEWTFGSYFMAGMGLTQLMLMFPGAERERYLPVVELCIQRLTQRDLRRFDADAWGGDALDTLDKRFGHAAYLGYLNTLLGLYRLVKGDNAQINQLNERVTATLARRLERAPAALIETYPGEAYPVDNAAVVASLALYDRAAGGTAHRQHVAVWSRQARRRFVEPVSGMLYQAADPIRGEPRDKPRASGTALAAYFLSFANSALSRDLFAALKGQCTRSVLGFGLINEYPPNMPAGRGDIDSGPVVLGVSFSGTGFAIAGARVHRHPALFTRLYRTAYLVGTPLEETGSRNFVTGGPLGNAIMLAMLTAGAV